METGSLIDIGCDTVSMWMVLNSHHNSSFYCFCWRRPVVVCSRREYKTRRSSAKLPEDYCFSLLAKCARIFSPFQAQVFVPLFMFYKRKKLINLFPEETQACACSHLNFAEGEFLTAAVLSPRKRMEMDLPAPDACWSWAGWPEVLLGTQEGKICGWEVCPLCANQTHGCWEDSLSIAQILSRIVWCLPVIAHESSS